MKIAFIGQKGIPAKSGGVETHVADLSKKLAKMGNEVYVYTRPHYTDKKIKTWEGVNLISLPSIRRKNLDAISHTFFACLDVIFRKKYDLIHFHSIGPSSLILLIKLFRPSLPIVATFHSPCYKNKKWSSFAKAYLKFGERTCIKHSDKVIAVSKKLKEYAEEKYESETIFIPNGVYMPKLKDPKVIKERYGLEKDSYILFVGRLVEQKGIQYIIDAYKKLKTDKKLVIVGGGFFSESFVFELINMAKDNPNIIFTGEQTGEVLEELFSNAYLYVQPSESEGMSISLLEGMSYGLPVLVSDIKENMEVVGNNGYSFKSKNVLDLIKKMEFLLNNKEQIRLKGDEARNHIYLHYNWDNIVEKITQIYHSSVEDKYGKNFFVKNSEDTI